MAGDSAQGRRSEPAFAEWFELGECEALGLLYERYALRIRAYCMRRLGNGNDADDAVQETFLKAQQGLHRFDRNAPFWPWLVTIAARVCTDMHRLHEHAAVRVVDPDPVVDPEEHAALRAKVAIVDDALRSMPGRYRTSLYLRHFEGSSYEEIARSQGTSLASVRSTLMRGRRQLGDRIEALARAERQWPLPSTISVLARRVRDRVRSWCRDIGRVLHAAVGVVDPTASFNALMSGAPAAMAVVGVLAALMGGAEAIRQPAAAEAAGPNAVVGGGPSSPGPLLTIGDRRAGLAVGAGNAPAAPFFTFEARTPPFVPDGSIPRTRAMAADNDDGSMDVYIEVLGIKSTIWTDCAGQAYERAGCAVARVALTAVEGQESQTPGVYDVEHGPASPHSR